MARKFSLSEKQTRKSRTNELLEQLLRGGDSCAGGSGGASILLLLREAIDFVCVN